MQAGAVDRSLGPAINIPAASLRTFITCSILFGSTIYDQIFVLIARKVTGYSSGITSVSELELGWPDLSLTWLLQLWLKSLEILGDMFSMPIQCHQ